MPNYQITERNGNHVSIRTVGEYRAYVAARDIARRRRELDELESKIHSWNNASLFEKITLWLDGCRPSKAEIKRVETRL